VTAIFFTKERMNEFLFASPVIMNVPIPDYTEHKRSLIALLERVLFHERGCNVINTCFLYGHSFDNLGPSQW